VPTVVELLNKRLTTAIGEDGITTHSLRRILSALGYLDLLQVKGFRQMCISWIGVILGSARPDRDRYLLAGDAVALLTSGRRVDSELPESLNQVQSVGIPPLLDFLFLSEEYYHAYDPPYPGAIALRLLSLSYSIRSGDLSQRLVPVLTSTLSTLHPLLSRVLALKLFQEHGSEWFSPPMEKFSNVDRAKLLEALGDPFHFSATFPSDTEHTHTVQVMYEPMDTAILLIDFASSDLWREHLRPSNFSSCEEIVSTAWGRHLASNCMLNKRICFRGEPLDTPTRLVTAIRRLQDLECWNTAEVLILYAWTSDIMDPANHDAWRMIGQETHDFYRTRGTAGLGTLVRGIKARYKNKELTGGVPCRVEGVRRPIRLATSRKGSQWDTHYIHRVCQLKRLYQFLGHDPATLKEVVATAKTSDEAFFRVELGRSGRSISATPTRFLEFACDYP